MRLQPSIVDSAANLIDRDTAQIYGNEAEVGRAIAESGIARADLFITTKIWIDNLAKGKLVASLKNSLAKLRTDHVDLALVHWPSPENAIPVVDFMSALVEAKAQGLTTRVGVSNFNIALMKEAITAVGASEIATNQIELHPFLQNRKVAEFAKSQGIVTSYMTLAYGKALKDPVIQAIAESHNATPAQVLLAWAMQLGYAVIPSSTKRENLASNLLAAQRRLNKSDRHASRHWIGASVSPARRA